MTELLTEPVAIGPEAAEEFDVLQRIEAAKGGDEIAFTELHAHYHSKLFRQAYSLTGNYHDAEDITQEAFARGFKGLDKFTPQNQNSFGGYLHVITRNVFYKQVEKQKRHTSEISLSADDDTVDKQCPGDTKSYDIVEQDIDVRRLIAAIRHHIAPEQQAEALLLHAAEWEYSDIAAFQGVPRGTAQSRVNRGRAKLQKLMNSRNAKTSESEATMPRTEA